MSSPMIRFRSLPRAGLGRSSKKQADNPVLAKSHVDGVALRVYYWGTNFLNVVAQKLDAFGYPKAGVWVPQGTKHVLCGLI